ncbi:hypothetical protein BMT54_10030 [Pasteurellaceae bacterium 15-036681]|nr:hypothetical protein BMT54_10030 [Pasteurellaceae bacterium 15-036681]
MITKIELALIERLKRGLGRLVTDVASYNGEFDDENLNIRRLPCALVSYGGSSFKPLSMSGRGSRFESSDVFVVIVMARSLRADASGRHGGVASSEIGVNQLVSAVKYLLTNQTLGAMVRPIKPKRVRTLWNNQEIKREKLSAYAVEFEISYSDSDGLGDGLFPVGSDDKSHPEWAFKHYQGQLGKADPELLRVNSQIFDPTNTAQVGIEVSIDESESS